ncbi:hypothetical protein CRUP_035098 [Coryphaenoides rupestris]|nr:hypothetical protein CRUP_035098 [Coryphaenoides rupestris]
MEVPNGPWADLTLLLRQTVGQTGGETGGSLLVCLLGLALFVCVCLLLGQVILYVWWKLEQEDELSAFPRAERDLYRPPDDTAPPRRRRSVGAHYAT